MNKLWYVIFALVALIILMILFEKDPSPEFQKQAYETDIAILKADRLTERHRFDSISKKSVQRAQKDSLALIASNAEITRLKKKAKEKVALIPPQVFQDHPEVEAALVSKDSVIVSLEVQNDSLKASVQFHVQVNRDLVQSHQAEANISKRIEQEQDERIAKLEKEVRKKSRGVRWLKASVVGAGILGLFVGTSL